MVTSSTKKNVAAAAAALDATSFNASQVPFLSDEERQKYAESIGFTTVGKHLPDDVTLQQVIKSMPPEVRMQLNCCIWMCSLTTQATCLIHRSHSTAGCLQASCSVSLCYSCARHARGHLTLVGNQL